MIFVLYDMDILFFIKLAMQGGGELPKNYQHWQKNAGCLLFILFGSFWIGLPQSNMLRPLGIKAFSLCFQTNSLLSLSEFDLGISFDNLIYSSICMVMLGSRCSLWLSKCLATVVLLLCLMSNILPWNLSTILFFFVCPTYFVCGTSYIPGNISSYYSGKCL